MKRIISWLLLLTLVLGLFAGCKSEQKTTETKPVEEDYITAQAAMEYLKALYKHSDEAVPTPRDYERYGVIRVGGEPFEVVWTVSLGEDMIKVVPGEDEKVIIDINEQCEEDTPYTLTATITDQGGNSVSYSWEYILPKAIDVGQVLKDAYALENGESLPYEVTLTGKITAIGAMYDPDYKNITVTMVMEGYDEYPITCYRLKGEGVEELDFGYIITVTGTIKNYNGTIEFDTGCILESWEKGESVAAPEDPVELVKQAYALADGETLPYTATLTGKVTEIETPYDPEYKNISIVFTVEGAEKYPITCYRLKGTGCDQIAVDDIVTVKGVIKNYKGKIEFDSGCMLLDRISGGREAEKPSTDPAKIFADIAKLGWGEHLNYYATLTGKVTDIESPYDKEYSNITVVIKVDGYSPAITCYRLKGNGVEKIARGDTITVKGIIENYKGKIEFGSGCTLLDRVSGGGVAKPETSNQTTILNDAAKLTDGQHLDYYSTLTGKVTEIQSPYDKNYGNITVLMNVAGTDIICYRLKTGAANVAKIAVGDTITVRGVLENYKGKLEYGTGCTLQKRVSGGGVAKPESSNQATILADAAALEDGQSLSYYANLTGKVTTIDTPYDKEYGNISVYMELSDGTSMYCYRLKSGAYNASKIAVGDTISVRGVIMNYQGGIQFGSGAELTKRVSGGGVAKPESSDQAAILADAAQLADGESLSYYANLTGKVTKIATAYDPSYGNISLYMDLSDGTNLYCYRLKSGAADASKIRVGDTISVRGVIMNYKGSIQFGSGCTLTKLVEGYNPGDDMTPAEILEAAYALEAGGKLEGQYTLTGVIASVDTAYSTQYKNITVTMKVEGSEDKPIQCFRLAKGAADVANLKVGDTITVTGSIVNYNGKIQFDQGCVLDAVESSGNTDSDPTEGGVNISFADVANRVTLTGDQQVWQQNGITVTNNKAGSNQAIADYSNPARFYKNTSLTIEYPEMTRIVFNVAFSDRVAALTDSLAGRDDVVVTVNDLLVIVDLKEAANSFEIASMANQTRVRDITVLTGTTPPEGGDDNTGGSTGTTGYVTSPVAGTAYKMGMDKGDGTVLYFNGLTESATVTYRLQTTTNINEAVDVYLESVSGGYRLYFMNGNTKTYIRVFHRTDGDPGWGKGSLEYVTSAPSETFVYDTTANTLVYDYDGNNAYYMGTYSTFTTFSVSNTSYITGNNAGNVDTTQFPARFYNADGTGSGTTPPAGGDDNTGTSGVVTSPVAGTAYKMGMDKGDGTILYFNGQTESASVTYRLATTTNINEAVDVYLESVSGGYRLYFMNGNTKTYIRVFHRTDGDPGWGKGSLEYVTTAPSETFVYDTTANTLVYDYDGNNAYYMGTYGTYTTFSVSNTSYITGNNAGNVDTTQFPARFYSVDNTGSGTTPPAGGDDNTGDDTGTTGVVTSPVAGTAYKMGMDKGDGTVLYFNGQTESASVTYRLATTTNVNEAVDVYLEEVSGGYLLYFMNGNTKTYIHVFHRTDGDPGWGKGSLEYVTTAPADYYTYDTTANTLVYDYDGNNAYYMGTYGTYTTFSVSNTSYITGNNAGNVDSTQFPARFYTVDSTGSGTTPPAGGDDNTGGDSGNTGGSTGTSGVVTSPVAGTAYKMGMDKGDGTVLYFNGLTESATVTYRLQTTTNINEAVDVYLESVSGGYQLYFMNGNTKTYIRVFHRTDGDPGWGKGSLEYVTSAPSETFVYDTTANTLVYDYDGNNAYYMGTYGTYTTFSVSNTSYITGNNAGNVDSTQFPARFYTVDSTGSGTTPPAGGDDNTGGDSGNTGGSTGTSGVVTSPVAGTAYKMGMDKGDGTILYFNGQTESASVTYRLATTTNINEAVDVYLESVSGGYRLYFMNGNTKTYIRVFHRTDGDPGWGKGSLEYVTSAPSETFVYDTTANTLVYDYDGNNAYYMGTYSTYVTFSVSNTSYITGNNAGNVDSTQFPARFYTSDGTGSGSTGGSTGGGTTTPDVPVTPPAGGNASYQQVTSLDEVKAGGTFVVAALYEGEYIVLDDSFATKPTGVVGGEGALTASGLAAWIVTAQGNGISIASAGKYLSYVSSTNIASQTSAFEWSISAGETAGTFRIYSGDRYICYQYTDDGIIIRNRFGMYKNPQSKGAYEFDLYLFKVVE